MRITSPHWQIANLLSCTYLKFALVPVLRPEAAPHFGFRQSTIEPNQSPEAW